MSKCFLCPRKCGVDREAGELGFCGERGSLSISRASLHLWEEPPISGKEGSGTVFFSGCNMRCLFCQNKLISRGGGARRELTVEELADLFLRLEDDGANNINLVTPTHFADKIALALESLAGRLSIPVVYNSSGYECLETLRRLEGLIDIYLPDFKYVSSDLSSKYSAAPDYAEVASAAICEMFAQVGGFELDGRGLMRRGLIVRHLVLPACRADSIAVLDRLASILPVSDIRLSLMSQYTPDFALDAPYKNLHRRLTSFEYNSVLEHAISLGFDGFFQARSSATSKYTPDF